MTAESAITNILPELGLDVPSVNLSDGSFQSRQLLSLINAPGRKVTPATARGLPSPTPVGTDYLAIYEAAKR